MFELSRKIAKSYDDFFQIPQKCSSFVFWKISLLLNFFFFISTSNSKVFDGPISSWKSSIDYKNLSLILNISIVSTRVLPKQWFNRNEKFFQPFDFHPNILRKYGFIIRKVLIRTFYIHLILICIMFYVFMHLVVLSNNSLKRILLKAVAFDVVSTKRSTILKMNRF